LGNEYRSFSSLLCNFLHSPVTSSLLGPNTLLNTLFSNTLSLRSSPVSATKFHAHTKQRVSRTLLKASNTLKPQSPNGPPVQFKLAEYRFFPYSSPLITRCHPFRGGGMNRYWQHLSMTGHICFQTAVELRTCNYQVPVVCSSATLRYAVTSQHIYY
jgi:hypothetical protein